MVNHKKSNSGSSATRLPGTPPVPKIAKGKRSARKRSDQNQIDMSAFDMLATIAGKILTEGDNFDNNKNENKKPEMIKPEPLDQDSCNEELKINSSSSSAELYGGAIKKIAEDENSGDNSSGCTQPKPIRANSWVSKKVTCSKYRKPNNDVEERSAFCNSKLFYTRQRTQFKKKKQFEVKNEGKKDRVKLSINSFKIPELIIEVSENTTVASLKKRVLEAMAAMLGDGLNVGVALQGRKFNFKDDNLNLAQAGINQGEKINNLDFSLEPELFKFKSNSNNNSHITDLTEPLSMYT